MYSKKRWLRFILMIFLGFILVSGYQNCSKMTEPAYVVHLKDQKSQEVPDVLKNKLEDIIDLSSLCVNYSLAENGASQCELYQGNLKAQLDSSLILLQKRYRSNFNGVAYVALLKSGEVVVIKTDLTIKVVAVLSSEVLKSYKDKLIQFKKELKESHSELACIDSVTSQTELIMNNNGHFQKFYSVSSCNPSRFAPDDQPESYESLLAAIEGFKEYLLDLLAENETPEINVCPIQMMVLPTCGANEQIVCAMVSDANSCTYQSCNCQDKPVGLCPKSEPSIPNCGIGQSLSSSTSTDMNGCLIKNYSCN